MMLSIHPFEEWESKDALQAHLEASGATATIVGQNAESPRKFYLLPSDLEATSIAIAVWSSGLGTKPSIVISANERGIVGHDSCLTWIDLRERSITKSHELHGVFYEFLPMRAEGEVLVIHELGVMKIDVLGSILWTVDTDVIERWEVVDGGDLILTEMDHSTNLGIAVESGQTYERAMPGVSGSQTTR